ncbi:MAG TPA: HPF/RaiA family ribosome-associated protein [Candidatus Binatia bacterium]|jgi:cold shock CspA family protein
MQVPLTMTFRKVRKTAAIEKLTRQQAAKLERVCSYITSCRIAIERPQEHQRTGNPFRVRLDVTVPPEHELVVTRDSTEGDLHEQLPTVIRDAFSAMRRQLMKLVEKQRGEVKTHPAQEAAGIVVRLFRGQGYGFIKSLDGEEVFFHKNSLPNHDFDRLELGTGVQWVEEEGEKGLQASTVVIVDKPGANTVAKGPATEAPLGGKPNSERSRGR